MSGDEVFFIRDGAGDTTDIQRPDPDRHYRNVSRTSMGRGAILGQRGSSERWERLLAALVVIPDMSQAACKGMHPSFDWPTDESLKRLGEPRLSAKEAPFYFIRATQTCATCPLTGIDGPCATYALSNDRHYSGVAGGFIYQDGRPLAQRDGLEESA